MAVRFPNLIVPGLFAVAVSASAAELPRPADPFRQKPEILPVGEAFVVDTLQAGDGIDVRWQMPPGYYLYRHAFDVSDAQGDPVDFQVPDGKRHVDEYFGEVEVYYGDVVLEFTLEGSESYAVRYQGCAEAGYCYPPEVIRVGIGE